MSKYHLGRNGEPGECRANKGKCPLGGKSEHFEEKQDAINEAEHRFTEENGGVFNGAALKSTGGSVSTANDTQTIEHDLFPVGTAEDKRKEKLLSYYKKREYEARERFETAKLQLESNPNTDELTAVILKFEKSMYEIDLGKREIESGKGEAPGAASVAGAEIALAF